MEKFFPTSQNRRVVRLLLAYFCTYYLLYLLEPLNGNLNLSMAFTLIGSLSCLYLYTRLTISSKGKTKLGWAAFCLFFVGITVETIGNIVTGEVAVAQPTLVVGSAIMVSAATTVIAWDTIQQFSKARIVLDSLWLSGCLAAAIYFPIIVPYVDLESVTGQDTTVLVVALIFPCISIGYLLSVLFQSRGQIFAQYQMICLSFLITTPVILYQIWLQETGTAFQPMEGTDILFKLILVSFGIASQASNQNKKLTIASIQRSSISWVSVLPLVAVLATVLLTIPSELIWFAAAAGTLMSLSVARILAINHENGELTQKLSVHATQDYLTGLPNRLALYDYFETVEADESWAVLFIDLDGFKAINDTYGHEAGDLVLKEVSANLKEHVRQDDFAARLGGDEFIVLAANVDDSNIDDLVERLRGEIDCQLMHHDIPIQVSATIGYAKCSLGTELEQVIGLADHAMLRAKKHARPRVTEFS